MMDHLMGQADPSASPAGSTIAAALQDAEALYLSLVEHIPICMYRIDLKGRLTFGNSAYLKDVGHPLEELLGKTVFDIFPLEEARKYDADDRRVIETGEVFRDVEEHQARGEVIYVEVLKFLVRDHLGRPVGVQGLYWDVTARKRAEDQARKTMAELERSNKDLEQFAAVASHDMHAPLRRILTVCQLLEEHCRDCPESETGELYSFIVSSAKQMQELIEDLLAHSRAGAFNKPLEPIDCNRAARAALSNLQLAIREAGAEVHLDPLPTVFANHVEMVRLFQNLIANAVKYAAKKTPRVEISAEPRQSHWLFRVKDEGIGIPANQRQRVFEAFHRLHSESEYPGTGLGLATCKKIVERLDGKIWVEPRPGGGSEFLFTIPNRAPQADPPEPAQ